MMTHVTTQQMDVIRTFSRHVEAILDSPHQWLEDNPRSTREVNNTGRREQRQWFHVQAAELVEKVSGRINEFDGLKRRAETINDSVSS